MIAALVAATLILLAFAFRSQQRTKSRSLLNSVTLVRLETGSLKALPLALAHKRSAWLKSTNQKIRVSV